jgi:hypothetical protein
MRTFAYALVAITMTFTTLAQQNKDKKAPADSVTFRGIVDEVFVRIQPSTGKVWVEAYVVRPTRMAINSRVYTPKWQGHIAAPYTKFEDGLKPFDANTKVVIDVKHGRSYVTVKEQPSAKNDWIASILISDQPEDVDEYNLKISW